MNTILPHSKPMKSFGNVRQIAIIVVGLLASLSLGQSSFFGSVRPDASVVVKKSSMGSDLVEITFQGGDYPKSVIADKLVRLGKVLGNEPRNVVSYVDGPVTKVTFVAIGLITDAKPRVNISPFAVALAFGERPIRSFSIFFEGLSPDVNTPTVWFPPNKSWKMEGVSMKAPKGLDYRVRVDTNNPNEIYMPDSNTPTNDSGKPVSGGPGNTFIVAGIVVGAIAIGLLVYSALLRPRPRGR